jgi:hypothetical protein
MNSSVDLYRKQKFNFTIELTLAVRLVIKNYCATVGMANSTFLANAIEHYCLFLGLRYFDTCGKATSVAEIPKKQVIQCPRWRLEDIDEGDILL